MSMTVSCPSCNKSLRIGEENQGKKMRCPSCQQVFKAPMLDGAADEAPPDPPRPDFDDRPPRREEYQEDRPSRRGGDDDRPSRRGRDDEDERPSRRGGRDDDRDRDDRPRGRDRDEDDRPSRRSFRDDDYDDRPSRRGRDYDDDYDDRRGASRGTGSGPYVCAILSCCLCIFPLIGFVLGLVAFLMANSALNGAPRGEERRKLESAKSIGIVGMCLSGGLFLLCCGINVVGNAAR